MPATCPPNTDCLLQALVDANSGFNWNPLNFAFTAALSILGFAVACFALFQAFLAAGPGRLKASYAALGTQYVKHTQTRFNFTELRFQTDTHVPLIDLSIILNPPDPSIPPPETHTTSYWNILP